MDHLLDNMPKLLSGKELENALAVFPEYNEEVATTGSQTERLIALSSIYQIYVPCQMTNQIYSKLYLAMLRSLQKKQSQLTVRQSYENIRMSKGLEYHGIMGGSDSFTIIGGSGVGKSSAVARCISVLTDNKPIETNNPYNKILGIVQIQCPFDCSVKGMLLEILRVLDQMLETKYYDSAIKSNATTDKLIGTVSTVALNHVGVLVVDEIQNITTNRNGKQLVGALTQLINNSGISICMVGMPEVKNYFSEGQQLARRSLGLEFSELEYGEEFKYFCSCLFRYQYVQHRTELSEEICKWLYEHSNGNISVVSFLIYNAQEIGILNGEEELNLNSLREAYSKRMSFLHGFIKPKKLPQISKVKKVQFKFEESISEMNDEVSIAELVTQSKNSGQDILELLKQHMNVEMIAV